jgi:acyl transferase domain-containing protein
MHHPYRLAIVAPNVTALRDMLSRWLTGEPSEALAGHAEDEKSAIRLLDPDTLTAQAQSIDAARHWVSGNAQWHNTGAAFRRIPLPGTIWQRRRCWLEPASAGAALPDRPAAQADVPAAHPTPAQVLKLFQDGLVSHAEAERALYLLQAASD